MVGRSSLTEETSLTIQLQPTGAQQTPHLPAATPARVLRTKLAGRRRRRRQDAPREEATARQPWSVTPLLPAFSMSRSFLPLRPLYLVIAFSWAYFSLVSLWDNEWLSIRWLCVSEGSSCMVVDRVGMFK